VDSLGQKRKKTGMTTSRIGLAWISIKHCDKDLQACVDGIIQEGEREKRVHPTQKPVALYERIIKELFRDDGIIKIFT
jgi:DNA modification methylase